MLKIFSTDVFQLAFGYAKQEGILLQTYPHRVKAGLEVLKEQEKIIIFAALSVETLAPMLKPLFVSYLKL